MKTQNTFSLALVLLLTFSTHFGPAHAKMSRLKQPKSKDTLSITDLLKEKKINPADVSLQILDGDTEVASLNPSLKKVPASVTKIFTAYAVLKKFSPGTKFYTRLYSDGKNIYLKGGGDPSFVSENMWYLVNEFTRAGQKNFEGNIVVDDTLFDRVRFDESRESTRVDRAYDSPVGAMSFNWNAVNVFVKPTKPGQKARVVVDPENGFFELVNNTTTVSGVPKKDLAVSISNSNKIITVSGEINEAAAEKAVFKALEDPALWAGVNLKAFLEQRAIKVAGKVTTGTTPADAELLATSESKSLGFIIADMNKFSNNFVAEMLTKNMAALEEKQNASLKRGVDLMREELKKIGISENDVILKNPSGLTRYNLFAADSLNKVLINIKNDFSIYPAFAESLPIAGIDGTLKRRFKNTPGEGWVRAKTGYLDGVASLAGYAGKRDGTVLTFSFLYNGPRDEAIVREAFDQILLNSIK
jgi:D-alanyl-D-alanine carboxypeptidase/D-alanyl-D-alanine-endopeptidase (penicillin-binding protein 4)